jgi:hypothetical protein
MTAHEQSGGRLQKVELERAAHVPHVQALEDRP